MTKSENAQFDIAFIVTISEKVCEMEELYLAFTAQMEAFGRSAEFIFVQKVAHQKGWESLLGMVARYPNCRAIRVRDVFTESDCLTIGFEQARATYVVTLPIYYQIDPRDIGALLDPLIRGSADIISAVRTQRKDSRLNQFESTVYNGLIRKITGSATHDLGSGVIAMKSEVARSLDIYGEFFRFIPILAERKGHKTTEVHVRHLSRRKKTGFYAGGAYVRTLLDILTIFFLVKFTKKPLRFFGLVGGFCFLLSLLSGLWLVAAKIAGEGIGNRPLLVLCALLAVLGIQLFSIGLIGEIIIFTHARRMKEYAVESIAQ